MVGCANAAKPSNEQGGDGDGDRTAQAQAQQGAVNFAYVGAGIGISGLIALGSWLTWSYLNKRAEIKNSADERSVWKAVITDALYRLSYSRFDDTAGQLPEHLAALADKSSSTQEPAHEQRRP